MNPVLKRKLPLAVIPLVLALLSIFVAARFATSAQFHAKTIAALEEKQMTVQELTAASTAASAALTLIPGDTATPIAEKLADLSSCFLVVLCAIYLEKYLLIITGYITFDFLVPISCLLYIINLFADWDALRALARKLLIFGIAIVLVIPVSVKISGLIEDTYQASIEATIEAAKRTTADVADSTEDLENETEEGFLAGLISKITNGISNAASSAAEKVGSMLNNFMEALAVMLVTSCVIPILVLLFVAWLIKVLFAVDLSGSCKNTPRGVRKGLKGSAGKGGQ